LAVWLGPVLEALARQETSVVSKASPPLRILWITPLRALAADTVRSLQEPVADLQLNWSVELRTGDTSASVKRRQLRSLPTALVTTPESLSLLLSQTDSQNLLGTVRLVVVDEWHELLGTKRGVQLELALARLRSWNPQLQTWGLSATLGNTSQAARVLLGQRGSSPLAATPTETLQLIPGISRKGLTVESLIPEVMERFPWGGHLGQRMLPAVAERIEQARTTLVFTNTRAQSELWYQSLLTRRPDWAGQIALHHGSLDQHVREWVEGSLKEGRLKCVVCTSSLDLGVDFSPVECVIQVGSPKGVARLLQRAGRSGHAPGQHSRIGCVPTHALELLEFAAAREAIAQQRIEPRSPVCAPLDVLVQHAVTIAAGPGFHAGDLLNEIRQTSAYAELPDAAWEWILDFISRGGPALQAYPDYRRVTSQDDRWQMTDPKLIRRHRMSIGTITADSALQVRFIKGPKLGTIEEAFIARLKPGDQFLFSGRVLEFVQLRDMTVWVRKSRAASAPVPRWMGGRMPLSSELAEMVLQQFARAAAGQFDSPELRACRPILELQAAWSALPAPGRLLIEQIRSRDGFRLFIYPFAGRLVHEGLAPLLAYRLAQHAPNTFSMTVNDYGLELLSTRDPQLHTALHRGLFSSEQLEADLQHCLNAAELGRRQFREIARISGLIFQGFPGSQTTTRQLQASAGLLFDVFQNYDPGNLLLAQAQREVLERQLDYTRLVACLDQLARAEVTVRTLERFTPLCFPLLVDRLRERLSTEKLSDRIARMTAPLERAAGQSG
jgi:ATP-dependent Lhr-like helicase